MDKKLILLPLSALLVLMMAGMVSASVACNVSVRNSMLNRNTEINVSYNNSDNTAGNLSAFIELVSASTENSSFVAVGNFTNTSNRLHVNATFTDELVFRDAANYQIRATCYLNASSSTGAAPTATSSTVTGIIIDRSVPVVRIASGLVSSKAYSPKQKWSITCANFTSSTVTFGSNSGKTMTKEGGGDRLQDATCSFTGTKMSVPEGVYKSVEFSATDGSNTTRAMLTSISIDIGIPLKQIAALVASGGVKTASGRSAGSSSNNNTALLVIIGLAAFWYVRRNKK